MQLRAWKARDFSPRTPSSGSRRSRRQAIASYIPLAVCSCASAHVRDMFGSPLCTPIVRRRCNDLEFLASAKMDDNGIQNHRHVACLCGVIIALADVGLTLFHVHNAQHGLRDRGPMADGGRCLTAALRPDLTSPVANSIMSIWQCGNHPKSLAVVGLTCPISLSLSTSTSCIAVLEAFALRRVSSLSTCPFGKYLRVGEHWYNDDYRIEHLHREALGLSALCRSCTYQIKSRSASHQRAPGLRLYPTSADRILVAHRVLCEPCLVPGVFDTSHATSMFLITKKERHEESPRYPHMALPRRPVKYLDDMLS